MRILFLSQLLPLPLDAGPKIRAYYVLRHLAEAGHDVTLLSFLRSNDRPADIASLKGFCRAVETVGLSRSRLKDIRDGLTSLWSETPFLIRRDQLPAMSERLERLLGDRSFDAVHADQLWMAPYAAASPAGLLKVLDQHNAVFRVPEQMASHHANPLARAALRHEASKLATFERTIFDAFGRVVWVSQDDRDAFPGLIEAHGPHAVIPIAVDPSARPAMPRPSPFRVTFLGGLHWPPNADGVRWFAEHVWPAVARAVPGAVFTVIGRGTLGQLGPAEYRARIDVTGYVADPCRYVEETAVFVVPLRTGAGMRVKILDAWCWGLPIVSTRIGAEGLEVVDGENLLVADEAPLFADRVVALLTDPVLARRVSVNGRATVESSYDWRRVYHAWNQVYH